MEQSIGELIPVLQVAIGPVILISGVGLLLLTLTNRLGRIVDRSRVLSLELHKESHPNIDRIIPQQQILLKRAKLVRHSILYAAVSVLFTTILIIDIFITALFKLKDAWLITVLFVCCMLSLMFSLIFFIKDINLSLEALKMELGEKT